MCRFIEREKNGEAPLEYHKTIAVAAVVMY